MPARQARLRAEAADAQLRRTQRDFLPDITGAAAYGGTRTQFDEAWSATLSLSWSIFDGLRSLSANIAVELPEAPEGGTLFRVLFLAAFLLFCLTFLVNTLAEVVRLRLRRRYRYL